MLCRNEREKTMPEQNFTAVTTPTRTEGVGRALQLAFLDGCELPDELKDCLIQLDRISF